MSELLTAALEAHGGLANWQRYSTISADAASGGELLDRKAPQSADPRRMTVWLHEQRASVTPFGSDDQRSAFRSDRVAIEKLSGATVAERKDPRLSFEGDDLDTPWDPPVRHLVYGQRHRPICTPPRRQAVVSADPSIPAAYRSQDAIDFYLQPIPAGPWSNEITFRSTRAARMYEPGHWITRVSPTPLLVVVARDDRLTVTDLALQAYERALQPKRLMLIPGGHFAPYLSAFPQAEAVATAWFREHLGGPATNIS